MDNTTHTVYENTEEDVFDVLEKPEVKVGHTIILQHNDQGKTIYDVILDEEGKKGIKESRQIIPDEINDENYGGKRRRHKRKSSKRRKASKRRKSSKRRTRRRMRK
jgi:hypothetical protein